MGDLPEKHELMEEAREALAKTLGPTEVLALALGAIVGWGCFMLPGITFLPNAGPLGTIIAFFIGAFFQCIVALGYSFLIKPYPVAGGAFVYAYAGFGSKGAFICGWALVLSYVCVIAANATAIILLVRFLLGESIQFGHLYTVLDWDIYLSEVGYITVILLVFGYMNFRGVDAASAVQVFLAFALTIGVLVLTIGTATAETASLDNLQPLFAENRSAIACVMMVLALTPWLYVGFDTIPQMAEEFSFSPGKARDLMLLSIICGAVIYALVTLCVAGLIPYKELLAANHDWATGWVANQIFGRWGGVALAVPVLAAILTGMNGFFMATTARLASSYDREVMAIPGRPEDTGSEGCNWLIKQNIAALVDRPGDIVRALGWQAAPQGPRQTSLDLFGPSDDERRVREILAEGEQNIDQLHLRTRIPVQDLSVILLKLELEGTVTQLPGNCYALC